jgi:predicted nucleic acid-binding protein
MNSSDFLTDTRVKLVADASVVINLNATARAAEIIKAVPNSFVVTENACIELEMGARNGHHDHRQLVELIDAGLIHRVRLGDADAAIYESLIDGSAMRTLDDGEAATIAYAQQNACIPLIDERKATTLCAASFPGMVVASTAELLIHECIAAAIGAQAQADALVKALTAARMRVPPQHLERLMAIIGPDRAALCASLPRIARQAAGKG